MIKGLDDMNFLCKAVREAFSSNQPEILLPFCHNSSRRLLLG